MKDNEPFFKEEKESLFFGDNSEPKMPEVKEVKAQEETEATTQGEEAKPKFNVDLSAIMPEEIEISDIEINLDDDDEEETKEEKVDPPVETKEEVKEEPVLKEENPDVVILANEKEEIKEEKEDTKETKDISELFENDNSQSVELASLDTEKEDTVIETKPKDEAGNLTEEKEEVKEEDNSQKEELKPTKSSIIVTVILAVIVLYICGKAIHNFYIGFKYQNVDNPVTENASNNNDQK